MAGDLLVGLYAGGVHNPSERRSQPE